MSEQKSPQTQLVLCFSFLEHSTVMSSQGRKRKKAMEERGSEGESERRVEKGGPEGRDEPGLWVKFNSNK